MKNISIIIILSMSLCSCGYFSSHFSVNKSPKKEDRRDREQPSIDGELSEVTLFRNIEGSYTLEGNLESVIVINEDRTILFEGVSLPLPGTEERMIPSAEQPLSLNPDTNEYESSGMAVTESGISHPFVMTLDFYNDYQISDVSFKLLLPPVVPAEINLPLCEDKLFEKSFLYRYNKILGEGDVRVAADFPEERSLEGLYLLIDNPIEFMQIDANQRVRSNLFVTNEDGFRTQLIYPHRIKVQPNDDRTTKAFYNVEDLDFFNVFVNAVYNAEALTLTLDMEVTLPPVLDVIVVPEGSSQMVFGRVTKKGKKGKNPPPVEKCVKATESSIFKSFEFEQEIE